MNIVTTRFGLIQVQESDLFRIPDGLVGFRAFTQFVLLTDPVTAGLTWLQSATAAELAFGLIAPPWRSATTGSSSGRATGRRWSWTKSVRRSPT